MLDTKIIQCCVESLQLAHSILDHDGFYFYHYTSPNGFMGIMQDEGKAKLWFTQYDSMNDKNERREFFDFYKKYCLEQKEQGVFSEALFNRLMELHESDACLITSRINEEIEVDGELIKTVTRARNEECDTFLCSFSSEADSLAMWNYYSKGNRYEGYNIRFLADNFEKINGFEKDFNIKLIKVVYSDDEKREILDRILLPVSDLFDKATDSDKKTFIIYIQNCLDNFQFSFKNRCFEHEKEIRAVLRIPKKAKESITKFERQYRLRDGILIPYVVLDLPSEVINGVTIGPLLEHNLAKRNTEAFLNSRGYKVDVMTSNIPIRF